MSIAAEQGAERLARVDGAWEAVDRIEITGSPERRTFTKFGADGKPLETTGVSPQPRPVPLPPT